jgi:hypothetical protein
MIHRDRPENMADMAAIEGSAAAGSSPAAPRRPPSGRAPATFALAALAVVLLTLGYVHVAGHGVVDPVGQPISDYIVLPAGGVVLGFGIAAAIVAVAALSRPIAELPDIRMVQTLLLVWCVAMAIGAVFPTNIPGTPADFSANVHRAAGAIQFATLPLAGYLLARKAVSVPEWRAPALWLYWFSIATGILSAAFLLSHVPMAFSGSSEFIPRGAVQRVLFVMEIALLALIAVAARRAAGARGAAR